MKTDFAANGPVLKHPDQSPDSALDARVLMEIVFATLTGVLSYVAAVFAYSVKTLYYSVRVKMVTRLLPTRTLLKISP